MCLELTPQQHAAQEHLINTQTCKRQQIVWPALQGKPAPSMDSLNQTILVTLVTIVQEETDYRPKTPVQLELSPISRT